MKMFDKKFGTSSGIQRREEGKQKGVMSLKVVQEEEAIRVVLSPTEAGVPQGQWETNLSSEERT